MKKIAVACFLAALPLLAAAQQPANPATYWQQEVKYSIDVALDDQKHELAGREELTYTNNSPQALSFIWFHLWPNAYRDTHTAWPSSSSATATASFSLPRPPTTASSTGWTSR
jgi:hypothetical protein